MSDDLPRVTYQTTPERKAWMKRQDESIREINERGIDMQMNDQGQELRNEIEEKDEQIAAVEETVQEAMNQLEELKEERSELVEQKEEIEEQKQDYNDWLDDLLDSVETGENARLIPDVIRARDGFSDYREGAEKIQQDLKELAIEQQRELYEEHFNKGGSRVFGRNYLYQEAGRDTEGEEEAGEGTNQEGSSYEIRYSGGTADD